MGDNGKKRKAGLNDRQLRFVQCYSGNASEAARMAGYKQPGMVGNRLMKKDKIRAAIGKRELSRTKADIKTREERQEFWSKMMVEAKRDADRLKASELLGKSQADFTEKILVGGLEQTLREIPDDEIDNRIRQLESQEAALRLEMGKGQEAVN